MIVPDANVLVYAHNRSVPEHEAARHWWEAVVGGSEPVGIDWTVVLAFVRLLSSPTIVERPLAPSALLAKAGAFLEQPNVRLVTPGPRHVAIMRELFEVTGAGSRLTTDVHLAALAIELDGRLATTDADFSRFPRLRSFNPLG